MILFIHLSLFLFLFPLLLHVRLSEGDLFSDPLPDYDNEEGNFNIDFGTIVTNHLSNHNRHHDNKWDDIKSNIALFDVPAEDSNSDNQLSVKAEKNLLTNIFDIAEEEEADHENLEFLDLLEIS